MLSDPTPRLPRLKACWTVAHNILLSRDVSPCVNLKIFSTGKTAIVVENLLRNIHQSNILNENILTNREVRLYLEPEH